MSLFEQLAMSWWQWMLPMSAQIVVLVLIIVLADSVLSRWLNPRVRVLLWGLFFVKLLLPPTLASPFSFVNISGISATALMTAGLAEESLAGTGRDVVRILFVVWLVGFLLCSAYAWHRYRALRKHLLTSPSLPVPQSLHASCRRTVDRLGMRRIPALRVQRGVAGPLVVGFIRPVLILPARVLETANEEQIEHVLLHELAHVKRRDPLTSLLCLLLQLIYWFHPAAWLARRKLGLLRELACDEVVAKLLGDATQSYRQTLLFFAQPLFQEPAKVGLAFIHRGSMLLKRLDFLERPRSSRLQVPLASFVLPVLLFCCVPMHERGPQISVTSMGFVTKPRGCLQLRYAVFAKLAEQERAASRD